MKYRAEIDGMRAIAVIPVILFHAGFELFSGGFVGVDVFFVISGYLITTILIEDIQNQRFSIVGFYERRARRILPALFVVMLACIPFAWSWLLAGQLRDFSQSLVAVSFFVSNILFWLESGYFSPAAEEKPLLHTWSLAVEEQYYILFPVMLFLLWRIGRNRAFLAIVLIAVASLLLSEWTRRSDAAANFYFVQTRAWELFAGSIAAFSLQARGVRSSNLLSLLGLAAIVGAVFAYDESTPFPSVYAALPVVGVVLLILFTDEKTLAAKVLGNRVAVGVGLISYSAYLWHQPLFAFAKLRGFGILRLEIAVLLIAIAMVLAYLTWRFVEMPVRDKRILGSRGGIFAFSVVGALLLASAGVYGQFAVAGDSLRVPAHLKLGGEYVADNAYLAQESWSLQRRINGERTYKVEGAASDRSALFNLADPRTKVLIVGNSHSVDFYNVLSFSEKASKMLQIARFGIQIKNVGEEFFASPNYANADAVIFCSMMRDDDINHIERLAGRLQSDGKKAYFCKNVLNWLERASYTRLDRLIIDGAKSGAPFPDVARSINSIYSTDYASDRSISPEVSEYAERVADTLEGLAARYGFGVVDRMSYVCPESGCRIVSDKLGKYLFDMGHHTLLGASHYGSVIDDGTLIEGIVHETAIVRSSRENKGNVSRRVVAP